MRTAILLANAFGFPALQLAIAWTFVRIPDRLFLHGRWHIFAWEQRFYRDVVGVRTWKRYLPTGGRWMGSTFDHHRAIETPEGRKQFLLETRRSEASHWTALVCCTIFWLWNPVWACWVMAAAGFVFNGPCLVVQRYNRAVLTRTLHPELKEPLTRS